MSEKINNNNYCIFNIYEYKYLDDERSGEGVTHIYLFEDRKMLQTVIKSRPSVIPRSSVLFVGA